MFQRPSASRVASRYLMAGMSSRVADAFLDSVKGKKFTNPETGNKVQFGSLPSDAQKKIRKDWSDSQDAEDLSDDAEMELDESDVEDVDDHGHGDGHGKAKSWKEKFKDLGDKAKSFMDKAPKAVKQFVEDPDFRKKSVKDMADSVAKAPAKYAKAVLDTAKHEVKEFKEAGAGIKAVLKGGKMDEHQKKALKAVTTHMALGIAAAALTASGPLAAAGTFGKGLAKHIAMKAVSNSLGSLHMLEELGHVGHGIKHVLHLAAEDKDVKDSDVDDVLMKYVSALVVAEIQKIKDADLGKCLKSLDEEDKKK